MRVPVTERPAGSPVLIVGAAFVIAFLALLLVHAPSRGQLAEWRPLSGGAGPYNAPAVAQADKATPANQTPIQARVGLQVGHWEAANLPAELSALRTEGGASAEGYKEVDINYAVAQLAAERLRARGITVDILPATIPVGYQADAFIAIHCDANNDPAIGGFKLARYGDSAIPDTDDKLLNAITAAYGPATGQKIDGLVSRAMIYYYAFNSGNFTHAIAPKTPGVIIELGFLTNPADRNLLITQQPTVAKALADGIVTFLAAR
ncbi:MAG: N-acetylmuramoyl-L-alanine amidase [Thermomicrobiales bacterium]